MTELKACPFCGDRPEVFVDNAVFSLLGIDEENTLFCVSCHCGIHTTYFHKREDAIEAWNRRAKEEKK